MPLADIAMDPNLPVGNLVTGGVVAAVLGLLAFMLRKSFVDLMSALDDLKRQVAGLSDKMADTHTAKALLERDVAELKAEVARQRERYHELAQQTTVLKGKVEVVYTRRTSSGEHRLAEGEG